MRGHRHHDRLVLAVLPQKINSQFEMRALHFAIDGLADVVQKCCTNGDVSVEPDFLGHDAGQAGDLG